MPRNVLVLVGVIAGVVAVRQGGLPTDLAIGDAAAGFGLVVAGWLVAGRRAGSLAGLLLLLSGVAWFVASLVPVALFVHRAPLVHLVVTDGRVRFEHAWQQAAVVAVYALAVITGLSLVPEAWLVVAAGLIALGGRRLVRRESRTKPSSLALSAASASLGAVLLGGATAHVLGADSDRAALLAYDVVLVAVAAVVTLGFVPRRRTDPVTRFVVDLGDDVGTGTLRDALARAVGDPRLILAFCGEPECEEYVDERGLPVEVPTPGPDVAVTPMVVGGLRTGVLVHDPAVLDDRRSIELLAGATALARTNAELQRDVRRRVEEVAASRTRLVASADAQRRRIEDTIRYGAAARLARVERRLADASAATASTSLAAIVGEVAAARAELLAFARGVHPETLRDHGLAAAVGELATRAGCELEIVASGTRHDPLVESTLYFVAAEAISNAVKHARATAVRVGLHEADDALVLRVVDDGAGGARAGTGGGLRGVSDRLEALGGTLVLDSVAGRGTTVEARLAVARSRSTAVPGGSPAIATGTAR